MILKHKNIDFDNAAKYLNQSVDPKNHESFIEGFCYTTETFFDFLMVIALINVVEVGVYNIDFNRILLECYEDLEREAKKMKLEEVHPFLEGANAAIEASLKYTEMCCFDSVNKVSA